MSSGCDVALVVALGSELSGELPNCSEIHPGLISPDKINQNMRCSFFSLHYPTCFFVLRGPNHNHSLHCPETLFRHFDD